MPPKMIVDDDQNRDQYCDKDVESQENDDTPLYIFEQTFEQVQANHVKSKYFLSPPSRQDEDSLIPLLEQVFDLVSKKEMNSRGTLMHIEMKVPRDLKKKSQYRYKKAVSQLHALIAQYDLAEFCMVQSFDHETLREFEL